jgi:hypothetical protein
MKRLHIQVQPVRSPALDVTEVVARLKVLASDVCVTRSEEDHEPCINIAFTSAVLSALWPSVRQELQSMAGLAAAAIVVCEGEHGWDDYLLLHHFDASEPLDELA